MRFHCWKPEEMNEEDGQIVTADDARSAATAYARIRHSRDDYPVVQYIQVRREHDIAITSWEVETEVVPEFLARPYTKPTMAPATPPASRKEP